MVGKPLQVDALSLDKEPKEVLVQFQVHTPKLPKLVVPLYVNGKGYRVEIIPVKQNATHDAAPHPLLANLIKIPTRTMKMTHTRLTKMILMPTGRGRNQRPQNP
jgi:hypothetical protein